MKQSPTPFGFGPEPGPSRSTGAADGLSDRSARPGARPPFGPDRPLDKSDAARAADLWAGMIRRERHRRHDATTLGDATTSKAVTGEDQAGPGTADTTSADPDGADSGDAGGDTQEVDAATGLPRPAAWQVTAARERLARMAADLRILAAGTWAVGSDDLAEVMASLDEVRTGADIASVLVTRDAAERGTVAASQSAGPAQWARHHAPSLDPAAAGLLGQVAAACTDQPRHELLAHLVGSGAVTYRVAAVALREAEKVSPDLELDTDVDEVLGWFLAGAAAGATPRELRRLSTWLRGQYGAAKAALDGEKAHGLNHLEATTLPDGVRRYLLHLCPEHAAVLDSALAALSGPAPTVDPDTGEQVRDERSVGRRRADALIEVVRRAGAAEEAGTSATATTKLTLTMSLADLLAGRGTSRTREGDLLDAGTVRRLACDADLIPAVLDTDSAVLDWGREKRLFDGPLRAAIVHRDQHCTFPGCGRPATWCQAHHVIHWLDGGRTALVNGALLCQRHHTIVHRDNLTATVSATGVVWDLTPRGHPPSSPTGYPDGAEPDDPGDPAAAGDT